MRFVPLAKPSVTTLIPPAGRILKKYAMAHQIASRPIDS